MLREHREKRIVLFGIIDGKAQGFFCLVGVWGLQMHDYRNREIDNLEWMAL